MLKILDTLRRDVAHALRVLTQSRGYAAAAIVSLALGIGANTAIFSILNSLLLKPLPVRDPDRLIAVASDEAGQDAALTYPIWKEVRDRRLLHEVFVWASDQVAVVEGGERKGLEAVWVDGNFFQALGVRAIAGRVLTGADDRRGGGQDGPVAVLSYTFWNRQFVRDPAAIGQTLNLGGVAFRIVGVTPADFFGLEIGKSFDVILPLETEPLLGRTPSRVTSPVWPWLHITGRLAPDEAIETVAARMRSAQPQIREVTMPPYLKVEYRDAYLKKPWTMREAATGSSRLRSRYAPALFILLGVVAFVLLIACANIANLQLARTAARRYEFSVRSALGASRTRIVQQQMIESFLLALSGTVLGCLFASWGSRVVVAQLSNWASTAVLDLSPDWRVLAVTSAVTGLTTLLFGAAPAIRASGADPIDALKESGPGRARGRRGVSGVVVIGQIAISLVLILGAGLFLRSFARLVYRDLGFERQRVLVAVVEIGEVKGLKNAALFARVREAVTGVPDVEAAAISMATPLGNAGLRLTRDVMLSQTSTIAHNVFTVPVSPGWFETYGTRLLSGRDFNAGDVRNGAGVAIVNEAFVRRYLGGGDSLGQEIVVKSDIDEREPVQIIGIAQDAAFTSVREEIEPMIYRPFAQFVDDKLLASAGSVSLSIRVARSLRSEMLRRSVSSAIQTLDPKIAVSFLPLSTYLDAYYVRERLLAVLSGFFGALALVLACVGLHGVTAYCVNERQWEIAVRMALGAQPDDVVRLVLRRFTMFTVAGVAAGIMLAWWMARLVGTLLYRVDPHDLGIFVIAAVSIASVGLASSWVPARRAASLNPAELLRM